MRTFQSTSNFIVGQKVWLHESTRSSDYLKKVTVIRITQSGQMTVEKKNDSGSLTYRFMKDLREIGSDPFYGTSRWLLTDEEAEVLRERLDNQKVVRAARGEWDIALKGLKIHHNTGYLGSKVSAEYKADMKAHLAKLNELIDIL